MTVTGRFCSIGAALLLAMTHATVGAKEPVRPAILYPAPTSAGDIADFTSGATGPTPTALQVAVQNLVERYGVDGVVLADGKVHPELPLQTGEAAVLLASVYTQLSAMEEAVMADIEAQYERLKTQAPSAKRDDMKKRLEALSLRHPDGFAFSYRPAGGCRFNPHDPITAELVYMDVQPETDKQKAAHAMRQIHKLDGLAQSRSIFNHKRPVTWAMAAKCLPGAGKTPVDFRSVQTAPMAPNTAMSRGAFLYALAERADAANIAMAEASAF